MGRFLWQMATTTKNKESDMNADIDRKRRVELGAMIRLWRNTRGMTQAQLAKASGFERTSITNIEQGTQRVTVEKLGHIAEALDVELVVAFRPMPETKPRLRYRWPGAAKSPTSE